MARSQVLLGAPLGADIQSVSTTPLFNLGARVYGTDGSEFVYVKAGAAITTGINQPNAVAIDEDSNAVLMTTALALAGHELGFAPLAVSTADLANVAVIPSASYFFAQTKGSNCLIRASASAAADTYLRTTITAGRLGTASTASAVVFTGVVLVVAASASTSIANSVREGLLTEGRMVRAGNGVADGWVN